MEDIILHHFFKNPGLQINIRSLAGALGKSKTSVFRSVNSLVEKKALIKTEKHNEHLLKLNETKTKVNQRLFNIEQLYTTGLVEFLIDAFDYPKAIVCFGSYSFGENSNKSDIDIAIETTIEKDVNLEPFEKELGFPIQLFFLTKKTPENLKMSMYNGVVLEGRL